MEKMTYEEAYAQLEKIIVALENGSIPMEEAEKLFIKGQELAKVCYSSLDKAKGKLTIIKEDLNKLIEE